MGRILNERGLVNRHSFRALAEKHGRRRAKRVTEVNGGISLMGTGLGRMIELAGQSSGKGLREARRRSEKSTVRA